MQWKIRRDWNHQNKNRNNDLILQLLTRLMVALIMMIWMILMKARKDLQIELAILVTNQHVRRRLQPKSGLYSVVVETVNHLLSKEDQLQLLFLNKGINHNLKK